MGSGPSQFSVAVTGWAEIFLRCTNIQKQSLDKVRNNVWIMFRTHPYTVSSSPTNHLSNMQKGHVYEVYCKCIFFSAISYYLLGTEKTLQWKSSPISTEYLQTHSDRQHHNFTQFLTLCSFFSVTLLCIQTHDAFDSHCVIFLSHTLSTNAINLNHTITE